MADDNANFGLLRIYLKDVSYESPSAPEVFKSRVEPKIEFRVHVTTRALGEDHHEVVVTGSVTAKTEDRTLFLCEAQQAGIFLVRGLEGEAFERRLQVYCPKQLFPFLRETMSNLTVKGGFPPLLLAPVAFEDLYVASKQPVAKA